MKDSDGTGEQHYQLSGNYGVLRLETDKPGEAIPRKAINIQASLGRRSRPHWLFVTAESQLRPLLMSEPCRKRQR